MSHLPEYDFGEWAEQVSVALRLVNFRHREDAFQEAVVARLEGRSPVAAIGTFQRRELRHERREVATPMIPRLPIHHHEGEDETSRLH